MHAGIKIQCLNQLGDSPTRVDDQRRQPIYVASDRVSDLIIFSVRPSHEGVNGQIAALANLPARGGLGELRFARHRCKYRTSRTGHPGLESLATEPFDGLGDRGTKPLGNRLQIVATKVESISDFSDSSLMRFAMCSKARDYSSRS